MFKIGDIVRCKTDRYGITTYKRPCEVVEIISDDKINVRCLDSDSSIYDVDTNLFELVPLHEILYKGREVKNSRGELYKFIKYHQNGISVESPRFCDDFISYDDIRYIKKFTV
jgi:hypothetical protein|nr:MAG TPA: hypothetical protein [Caudoviricetes sp.]